jgi:uncharacterized protein (DUF1697 family)
VFSLRYGLDSYILFRRASSFKGFIKPLPYVAERGRNYRGNLGAFYETALTSGEMKVLQRSQHRR